MRVRGWTLGVGLICALGLLARDRLAQGDPPDRDHRGDRDHRDVLHGVGGGHARPSRVDSAPLVVHGPFRLSAPELGRLRDRHIERLPGVDLDDDGADDRPPGPPPAPRDLCRKLTDSVLDRARPGTPSLTAPPASPPFLFGGQIKASIQDPQIAVGGKDIVAGLRSTLLIWDKATVAALPPGATPTPTFIATDDFFGKLTDDINSTLVLPVGYQVADGYGIDPLSFPGNTYYDLRVQWDSYRHRFWAVAIVINQKTSPITPGTTSDPVRQSARRTKLAVAVSESDDALGAWNLYWWDANHDEDHDWRTKSTQGLSRVDYPVIGFSERWLLVENKAGFCPTGAPAPSCQGVSPFIEDYDFVTAVSADSLASGRLIEEHAAARQFWNFRDPDGNIVSSNRVLEPAKHHGPVPLGASFFTQPFAHANGDTSLIVRVLDDANPKAPTFFDYEVPVRDASIVDGIIAATTAVVGDGHLVAAFTEDIPCPGNDFWAVRLVDSEVVSGKVVLDRTIGRRSVDDPPSVDFVTYFRPDVEINANGDIALGYARRGPNLLAEARYTVVYRHGLEQPPSGLLAPGSVVYPGGYDTTGASLDPDGVGIWLAVPFAQGGLGIAVGRVF